MRVPETPSPEPTGTEHPAPHRSNRFRLVLLANTHELLAGSKASAKKLHCYDLWDKRMQKEAVQIMMRRNDSRVVKYRREMSKLLYPMKTMQSVQLSPARLSPLRPPPLKRLKAVSISSLSSLCQAQLSSTAQLRLKLTKDSVLFQNHRTLHQTFQTELADLSEFVKDEVRSYKAQSGTLQVNHSAVLKVANKKKIFGVQFYEAQRRRRGREFLSF